MTPRRIAVVLNKTAFPKIHIYDHDGVAACGAIDPALSDSTRTFLKYTEEERCAWCDEALRSGISKQGFPIDTTPLLEETQVALDALIEVFGERAHMTTWPDQVAVEGIGIMRASVGIRLARWEKACPGVVELSYLPNKDLWLNTREIPVPAGDPVPIPEPCCRKLLVGSHYRGGTVCVFCHRTLVPRTKRATP